MKLKSCRQSSSVVNDAVYNIDVVLSLSISGTLPVRDLGHFICSKDYWSHLMRVTLQSASSQAPQK